MFQILRHPVGLAVFMATIAPLTAQADPVASALPTQTQQFDDQVQPLVPKQARTEEEHDRIEAASLFAAGRALEQKQDYEGALRRYQRAFRYDPDATVILREIIPLGFTLNRQTEAIRYALILADRDATDPMLLLQLGRYVTEEGNFDQAIALYEKALEIQEKEKAKDKDAATKIKLRMELGRLCFLAKKYEKAADAFVKVNEALDKPKDFGIDALAQKELLGDGGLTYELFGETFLECNRLPEARAAFEKSNKLAPNAPVLAYNLARLHDKDGHPAEAIEKLQVYFGAKEASRGTGPYELLAKVMKDLNREDQITSRLETLHTDDPENLPLAYSLGHRDQDAGKLDQAVLLYTQILSKKPSLDVFEALTQVYRQTKDANGLLSMLANAIGKTGTLEVLGNSRKELVEDAPLVQAVLDAARAKFKDKPDDFDVNLRLAAGMLALEAKQFDAAAEFLGLALELKPKNTTEVLLAWGLELFVAERFDDAIGVFQRGVDMKLEPDDEATVQFYLAGSLEMKGRTEEALAAAKKAADGRPKSARFQSRAPWIAYHAKRIDDALKGYTDLLEKFDADHESDENRSVMREARLTLSNLNVLKENLADGEEWLEQVLDEFPDDVGARNDLGYLWADQGKNLGRALKMLQKAVAAEPKSTAYRDSLGWCLFKLGRNEEALAELKVATGQSEEGDPDPVILDHLGDVQAKLNNREAAVEAWVRAIPAFEKQNETEKAKATQAKIDKAKVE